MLTIVGAEVELSPDGSRLPEGVARNIDAGSVAPMQRVGLGLVGKLFTGLLAFKGVQMVGEWVAGAVEDGSDLNETINKSTTVFGREFLEVDRWADRAAVNVGLSRGSALSAATSLGDMFTQLGFTSGAAADLSTGAVQVAADLGSFHNLETGDVLERITAALRGEYDALQSVIPNINAARVEAEALAASGKTAASELTAQERAAAVLAIVNRDGARAMGDFARTNEDYANSSKVAKAQLEDISAEVGTALLPTATDLMSAVRSHLIPLLQGMAGWLSSNRENVSGWLVGVGAAAVTFVALNAGWTAYTAIMGAYQGGAVIATAAQWALNAALTLNPIGLIVAGVAALVGAIVWLATQTTVLQDGWQALTTALGTAWSWLWGSVLSPVIAGIGTAASWLYGAVFAPVGEAVGAIGTGLTWLYESVVAPVVTGIMLYIGLWAAVIVWLWENVASPTFGLIGQAFSWLYASVIAPVGAAIDATIDGVGAVVSWLYASAVQPAISGVGAAFSWVGGIVSGVAGYIGVAARAGGAAFSWLYAAAVQPAVNGVGSALTWARDNLVTPLASFLTSAMSSVGGAWRAFGEGLGSAFAAMGQSVLGAVRGPVNGIIALANSAIDGLNGLKVEVPDWVPLVGGQQWGLNLPRIPMLADGGIVQVAGTVLVGERGPEYLTHPVTLGRSLAEATPPRVHTITTDNPELAGRKLARIVLGTL